MEKETEKIDQLAPNELETWVRKAAINSLMDMVSFNILDSDFAKLEQRIIDRLENKPALIKELLEKWG